MRRFLLTALVVSLIAVTASSKGSKRPIPVRLKDGSRVVGYIEENSCTNEALVLRDMRTKRKITIPWSKLMPETAHKLRVELGFEVEEARGGHMIKATRIRNKTGNVFTGVILNRATAAADGYYELKKSDGVLRIRISDVREETIVEVDARRVFTPMELYDRKLAEKAPETASDHFQLAEYCRLVGALEQAKEHYAKVLRLDNSKYPESAIQRLISLVEKRLNSRDAEGKLGSISRHIVYNRFAKAKAELALFTEQYGSDEDFAREIERIGQRLEKSRAEYFANAVAKRLLSEVKKVLGEKVRADELTIREAMNFASAGPSADDSASKTAIDNVAADLKLMPEEVVELWKVRPKRVIHKAFYRDGTFMVEENLKDALSRAPKPKFAKGRKPPKLPKPRPAMTAERWWKGKRKSRKWSELRDFLYAVWAEKSGAVELLPPKQDACQTCAGKGYVIQSISTTSGNVIFANRCNTCHMATHFRIVRFK